VTTTYLDTSAAMRLLLEEPESEALVQQLVTEPSRLVASWLLHTELHSAAGRNPAVFDLDDIQAVLETVTLVDVSRGDLLGAGTHSTLRSNDAIHLATALRLGVDEMLSYDAELLAAARRAGLAVLSPA